MKTCPVCRRIYSDETYSFCLEDGALLSDLYDSQATMKMPLPLDSIPTVFVPPTQQFQPGPTQPDVIQTLLNYLKENRQNFSTLGRFSYNNDYIWTNGHFFEIAENIPSVLTDFFPLKEGSGPVELIKSLQTQLTSTYTAIQGIAPSEKEGMSDLTSDNRIVRVNNIYYQYLQLRYPKAVVMLGASPYNPALFALDKKLRAGIMGVKI